MESQFFLIIRQLAMMFLLVVLGVILYRKDMLSDKTTKQISNLILYIVSPCITVVSFIQPYSTEKLIGFGVSLLYSFIIIFIGLGVGRLVLGDSRRLETYACGFSNAGFVGIPLVSGVLGIEYVFNLSAFFVAFNLISWTYGLYLISGQKNFSVKKLMMNPAIFSVFLGFAIFVLQIPLPDFLFNTIESLGSMNTPLAMIVLGTYVANEPLMNIFKNKMAFEVSFLRLLVVPLIVLVLLKFAYVPIHEIKTILLIASCAPCGATLAMFCQLYGADYNYGARIVSLSTVLCPFTIVLVMTLMQIFGI